MTTTNSVTPLTQKASGDSPTQIFLDTPPAVLHLLGYSAPFIRTLSPIAQALTWSSSNPWLPWLILASWWMICLLGDTLFTYGLNASLLLLLGIGYLSKPTKPEADISMSPERLQLLLEETRHFNRAIQNLIQTYYIPLRNFFVWKNQQESKLAITYLLTSYPAYLMITHYLGTRYLFLGIGTLALTWHARWAQILRRATSKSLIFRWTAATVRSISLPGGRNILVQFKRGRRAKGIFLSQTPVEIDAKTDVVVTQAQEEAPEAEPDVEFVFTVYQNERWWMGLDWTQALLPNERPPWTDYTHAPVAPPSSFSLPATQTSLIPAPTKLDPQAKIKRTTTWQWIDPDWHVRPDSSATQPVIASAASTTLQSSANTASPSNPAAFADWARNKALFSTNAAASARRNSGDKGSPSVKHQRRVSVPGFEDAEGELGLPRGAAMKEETEEHWSADEDGWQYGSTAWDKMGSKSGLGRYTRRRVWLRRAKVIEEAERIPSEMDKDGLRQRVKSSTSD